MKKLIVLVIWVLSSFISFAQTDEPKIVVNAPSTAVAGEKIVVDFSISFNTITPDEEFNVEFSCPHINGATILSRSNSHGSSMCFENGKMVAQRSYTHSLTIYFKEPGSYDINNASFIINNNDTYAPQPFPIEITPNSTGEAHLKFRGISIDGNVDDYCGKLTELGYTRMLYHQREEDRYAGFNGRYGGVECELYVYCTPLTNTIYGVHVCLAGGSWNKTKEVYDKFQGLLNKKYGSPIHTVNTINDNQGNELEAIVSEKAQVFSSYCDKYPDLGWIALYIWVTENGNGYVVIQFTDSANMELSDKEVLDSL